MGHPAMLEKLEWAHLGSNQGPTGYEPVALPAELWARQFQRLLTLTLNFVNQYLDYIFASVFI